ncbi:MAG: hypothetical protein CVV44_04570 [Spirochaetae bacterium HGW-Spirochaetae-1]|jgi:tetratricopeptide (TPR) repeat protein|nr:MAG: hypothetical protein CVV44_04570 [Spirochaetae bacterium HGW-Spirochaetae-1]
MKKSILAILLMMTFFSMTILHSALNTESQFKQGVEAFHSGNYASAELIFKRIMDSDDEELKEQAWFFLARSIYYQKNYKSALYEFNSYLNKCRTTALCNEARYWIGEIYYSQKEYNKAIEEYKRYIDKTKEGGLVAFAHDRIGSIYYSQNRYDEAILEWEKSIQACDDKNMNALRVYNIGEALFKNNKPEESLQRLSPLLTSKADPKIIARARIISGRIYQQNENHNRAILLFSGVPRDLLKITPYSEVQYFQALSLLKKGDVNSAKSLLEMFSLIGKDSEWYLNALFELGKIQVEQNEEEKGLPLLEEVRQAMGKPELKKEAARFLSRYYLKKDPARAIPYLEDSIASSTGDDDRESMILLGKAYVSANRFDEAEKTLNSYAKKYPYDSEMDQVNFLRARIYLEKNEINRAMELLQELKRENPFSKYLNESNYYLGIVNFRKNDFQKAVSFFNSYLKIGDIENRYDAMVYLVRCHIELKDLKRGDAILKNLLRIYSDKNEVADILLAFIMALRENGKNNAAYINILISRFPESASTLRIYFIMANEYFAGKNFKKSAEFYQKYLEGNLAQERGLSYYNLLLSLYNMEKYNEVITIIKKGDIPPMDEQQWKEIPLLLSRSNYKLGEYEKVYNQLITENLEVLPVDIKYIFFKSAVHSGDIQTALKAMELFSNEKEYTAEANYDIGDYYAKNGDIEEAMSRYSLIIREYPDTKYVDFAKIGYAEIYLSRNKYAEVISTLQEIKNNELRNRKNALLILCYFSMEEWSNAVNITNKEIQRLLGSPYGESIIRANLKYFYMIKNVAQFQRFAGYLSKFPGNEVYLNYMYGKIYYDIKSYKNAYYYLYKISLNENDYMDETLFILGEISLYIYKNKSQALKYFEKIIDVNKDSEFGYRARLKLSLLYNEDGQQERTRDILLEILKSPRKKTYNIQAMNIYEYLGFDKALLKDVIN